MLRISPVLLLLTLALAVTGVAHADTPKALTVSAGGKPDTAHHLSKVEIDARVSSVSPELRRCYLASATDVKGAGHLEVKLTVQRSGALRAVEVATPGVPVQLARAIDGCVRAAVAGLQFPAKKATNTIVVPFFFQHTAAPNSGPQESCWDPRGCRTR
ncbi:MAG: hypothetical protein KIT31_14945 [Deltaproteobacteria bacterium]|nr:hypothetical protein [Deltaproteobacteria bacterium]